MSFDFSKNKNHVPFGTSPFFGKTGDMTKPEAQDNTTQQTEKKLTRKLMTAEQVRPGLFYVRGEWTLQKSTPTLKAEIRFNPHKLTSAPPANFSFGQPSSFPSLKSEKEDELFEHRTEFEIQDYHYTFNGSLKKNQSESSACLQLCSNGVVITKLNDKDGKCHAPSAVWVFFNDGDKQPHIFELQFEMISNRFISENLKDEFFFVLPPRTMTFDLWIEFESFTEGQKNLLSHLTSMFDNQNNCDVHFSFPNGEKLGAHAIILSARSQVLASMFQNVAEEPATRQFDIEDIKPEIFQQLLRYIYSGRQCKPLTEDTARSLYAAADKYDIGDLKDDCICYLLPVVRIENVLNLLAWADLYSADKLKEKALSVIASNGRVLCNSKDWENLAKNHHGLCVAATRRIIDQLSSISSINQPFVPL